MVCVQGYWDLTIEHDQQQLLVFEMEIIPNVSNKKHIHIYFACFIGDLFDDDAISIYLDGTIDCFGKNCELKNGDFKKFSHSIMLKKQKFQIQVLHPSFSLTVDIAGDLSGKNFQRFKLRLKCSLINCGDKYYKRCDLAIMSIDDCALNINLNILTNCNCLRKNIEMTPDWKKCHIHRYRRIIQPKSKTKYRIYQKKNIMYSSITLDEIEIVLVDDNTLVNEYFDGAQIMI